jgi:hypothetical protein
MSSWDARIERACAIEDPVLCNVTVTVLHYELSLALRDVVGAEAGANFHTWATWGSKKAGTTIRREDVRGPLRVVAAPALGRASRSILRGNVIVLDDVGRVSGRFVETFAAEDEPDEARIAAFLDTLRPGPPSLEGQDLLRKAFRHYWLARHEEDPNTKHEHTLLANLQAILHEHVRLEPFIEGAMPRRMRKYVTRRLLDFHAGVEHLKVADDVPEWDTPGAPTTLRHITNPDLAHFLAGPGGFDRTPDSLDGSRAADWTDIRDRMNYIVDLFRSRHFDEGLFVEPYTPAQTADILDGRVPAPPL